MRSLAALLLLSTTAFATERLPAPRQADAATLKSALERCKVTHPRGDPCFNLQLALSAALLRDGNARAASEVADRAGRDVQQTWADADDVYISAQSRAGRPGATDADKAAYARATAEWRRLWVDQAVAAEAQGAADVARGFHRGARQAFSQAASIRKEYGDGPANRDARIRAAASAAVALAGAESVAEGEAELRPVLAEAEQVHGRTHPLTAGITLDLADLLAQRTAYAEADTLFARARTALRRDPVAAIEADARYTRFLVRADRKREAEPLARDILARLLAARADQGRVATAYLDLAAIVPLADALPLAEQGAALRTARFGEKHVETARANIAVARLMERYGRHAEAEALRRPALIQIQAANSIEHPETATAYLELGENLIQQGRPKDAVYICRTALRGFDASAGRESAGAARAALLLAMAVFAAGTEDPHPLIARAMPVIRTNLAPTHVERVQAEFIVAMMLYYAERDVAGALRQMRIVTSAGLERARSYPDFGPEAQREMREMAPAFAAHVRFAWETSRLTAGN